MHGRWQALGKPLWVPRSRWTKSLAAVGYVIGVGGVVLRIWMAPGDFVANFGVGMAALCLYLVGTMLYLPLIRWARMARQWRLPKVQHAATRSAWGVATVLVVPPTLIAWIFLTWTDVLMVALLGACLAATSALFFLFSHRGNSGGYFIQAAIIVLLISQPWVWHALHTPSFWFVVALASIDLLLVWTAIHRWRRLCRSECWTGSELVFPRERSTRASLAEPMARWNALMGFLERWLHATGLRHLTSRPDMQRLGPRYRTRSLRMALGGFWLPQARGPRFANRMLILMIVLTVVGFGWMMMFGLGIGKMLALAMIGMMLASAMIAFRMLSALAQLRNTWSRPNAEVPLLALLPNLQPEGRSRRWLLGVITRPLWWYLALQLLCCLLMIYAEHLSAGLIVLILALFIGTATGTVVLPLLTWGSHRTGLARFLWFVLVCLVFATLVAISLPVVGVPEALITTQVFALLWALYIVCLAGFGWRGWLRWRTWPHPFLTQN